LKNSPLSFESKQNRMSMRNLPHTIKILPKLIKNHSLIFLKGSDHRCNFK